MSSNRMADLVGPFYDGDAVARLLSVDPSDLPGLCESGQVLGVQTSDDAWIYPVSQFDGDRVDPRLLPLLAAFRDVPAWTFAVWLAGPEPELDGLSPVEWVRQGRPSELVLRLAHQYAHHVTS